MKAVDNFPRLVTIQHTIPAHREALRRKLSGHRELPALNPLSWPGEIGTWRGIDRVNTQYV